jgi:hypothetical protein
VLGCIPRVEAQSLAEPAGLKQGEFRWAPQRAPRGPVVVIVSLPDQLTFVYRNGIRIGVATCSTGKAGHRTPTGVFTVLQKRTEHYSSTYNNAPMPYMQRLTWRGIALHAGDLPGYPASAGCVRLPLDFAKSMFEVTHVGTPVIVADARNAPLAVVSPGILLPEEAREQAEAAVEAERRKSKKNPWDATVREDVRSIIVSGADRKAVVMLNGAVEIEREVRIREPDRPLGTQAFALLGPDPRGRLLNWMSYGIGGAAAEGVVANRQTSETLARIQLVDREEAMRIASTYRPGTTLVVTDLSASPETRTGPDFLLADSEPYRMPRNQMPKAKKAPPPPAAPASTSDP